MRRHHFNRFDCSPSDDRGELLARGTAGVDSFASEICDTLDACTTGQVPATVGMSHSTIIGTDGDDTLTGTPAADVICGVAGDDVIDGLSGDDTLIGGCDGILTGNEGADTCRRGETIARCEA